MVNNSKEKKEPHTSESHTKTFLTAALALTLTLGACSSSPKDVYEQQEIVEKTEQILEEKINSYKELVEKENKLRDMIDSGDSNRNVKEEYRRIRKKIEDVKGEIEDTKKDLDKQKEKLQELKEENPERNDSVYTTDFDGYTACNHTEINTNPTQNTNNTEDKKIG